ncbi:MAG: threonine ammonia-lyase, partial [Lachnospiraceae bacterium]|nr:threonine ammonia-lyase [Lachnospiraceae bacterium]
RGAYYRISTLSDEERAKGVITASAGNHAQGVAYAAREYKTRAVIVMPTTTPLIKVNRTKALGAEVVLFGDVYDDAATEAFRIAKEEGLTFVHPFDDEGVATGQGSIAMEIFKELPLVDYILVPVGGGGLATGVSTLAKLMHPNVKVIGVEPEGAACLTASIKAGKVVTLDSASTIADGTAVKTPGSKIFPYLKKNLDDVITIADSDLVIAFLDMVENHKMIVENSGLLTVAALKKLNITDKKIVSILSGGNMDIITMSSVVQQGLIYRDRIFTVSTLLPDRPGSLEKVSAVIARENGNVIKLEHNQFVTTNRSAAVELRITIEAFGPEHKKQILDALDKSGFKPKIVRTLL